jgi:hypothetical protein
MAPPPPAGGHEPDAGQRHRKARPGDRRATARWRRAAITATITGVAPTSMAAWLTLVRVSPAFGSRIDPP